MKIEPNDALIVVDVQNDFCPGGALEVGEGHRVAHVINEIMPKFAHVVFTRDWHPDNHCSFGNPPDFCDGSWPPHCIQHSPGAEFLGSLHIPKEAHIISKGQSADAEEYSGFANGKLAPLLRELGVRRVFVCGLATEFCVHATALDAIRNKFDAVLVENACRGVNFPPGSAAHAIEDMREAGVKIHWSGDFE
jgi:nicotinamidase/pyrazinamidase